MSNFAAELATYERHKAALLPEHEGRFLVLKGEEWFGPLETYDDALRCGYSMFGLDGFMVRPLHAVEPMHYISRDLGPDSRTREVPELYRDSLALLVNLLLAEKPARTPDGRSPMTAPDLEVLAAKAHRLRRSAFCQRLYLLGSPVSMSIVATLHAGPLPVDAIRERVEFSRPAISSTLMALVKSGLVEQDADRPAETYRLSPYGRALVEALAPLAAALPMNS